MSNNSTLNAFKAQQEQNRKVLADLQGFVKMGEDLGVIDEDKSKAMEKIDNAFKQIDRLKIALIGGFSEGKTSIAAAWLENLDKQSMNISAQESSNAIAIYNYGDDIEIVDTPGLFGFKEKESNGNIEQYKDITKKYVSEAHIVLYVLNPSNPIKESHKEDLQWLFRELNLLPRTIFVLGKFDEVADVEDEAEFNDMLNTKKHNVINRLNEFIALTQSERESLRIVAVSANPFSKGVEYWLSNLEEFKKLSHIASLQEATKEKIAQNGGKDVIIEEAKSSIVKDIIHKQLPVAKKQNEQIAEATESLKKSIAKSSNDLAKLNKNIGEAQIALREFCMRYFDDLILQLNGTSLETFNEFVVREIGDCGINIENRVKSEFQNQTEGIIDEMGRIATDFELERSNLEKNLVSYGKQGAQWLQKSGLINANNIKLARDTIVEGGKLIGINFGKALKFKPWGAVNLAAKASAALAIIGVLLEAWDSWQEHQKQQEFNEAKEKMVGNFNKQKKELLEFIDSDNFRSLFAQENTLLEYFDKCQKALEKQEQEKQQFEQWVAMGEKIAKSITYNP